MLEKILLYNVKRPQDIIKAASNMRIISGFINESDTDRTLAEIAEAYHYQMQRDISHKKIKRVLLYFVM